MRREAEMATRLGTDFPDVPTGKGDDTSPYPWDEWLDGDVWSAIYREDFDVNIRSFSGTLRSKAQHENKRVEIKTYGVTVLFRFTDLPPLPFTRSDAVRGAKAAELSGGKA